MLAPLFRGSLPVLVHIHGNNMTPAQCFERCTRLAELYGVEGIGFSWPSEGLTPKGKRLRLDRQARGEANNDGWRLDSVHAGALASATGVIARYRRAKKNGTQSAAARARFFNLVGRALAVAGRQPLSLSAHSLGAHCLQQMLALSGVAAGLPKSRNIALLAPCVPRSGHPGWIGQLTRTGQVVVIHNISDLVLLGAQYADGLTHPKLGNTALYPPLLPAGNSRCVDFLREAPMQHEYFVAPAGRPPAPAVVDVFKHVFGSKDDIAAGQNPCAVYPGCCDAGTQVCEMV